MTVIAWDGHTLAADKRACLGSLTYTVTKIKKINGCLVAGSGDFSPILAMMKWFEDGADIKALPDCQKDKDRYTSLIVITPDKKILRYEQDGIPHEVEDRIYAIGSGRDFALAAMEMGADAARAIEVASKFACDCGNGWDTLTLEDS